MLGEPVQLPVGRLGGAQRLPERGREVAQDADFGLARRRVPAGFPIIYPERTRVLRIDKLGRVLGGSALGRRVLRLADHVLDLVGPDACPGHDAGGGTVTAPVDGDDGELAGA